MFTRTFFAILILGLFTTKGSGGVMATNTVTLAWNPVPGAAGYRLYVGSASRTYFGFQDVGLATTSAVRNLRAGVSYYFAVTDYDTNSLESAFSTEIGYTVPVPPDGTRLKLLITSSQARQLSGVGPVGQSYAVETSSNLVDWAAIGRVTNNAAGAFKFLDRGSPKTPRRFYRLHRAAP